MIDCYAWTKEELSRYPWTKKVYIQSMLDIINPREMRWANMLVKNHRCTDWWKFWKRTHYVVYAEGGVRIIRCDKCNTEMITFKKTKEKSGKKPIQKSKRCTGVRTASKHSSNQKSRKGRSVKGAGKSSSRKIGKR